MKITQVLKRPILTEKSMNRLGLNQYTFEVDKKASKKDIARAVTEAFQVEVYQVKVINRRGKRKRAGARTGRQVMTSGQRKAIVTINPKQKIPMFEELEKEAA